MTSVEIAATAIAKGWIQVSVKKPDAVEKVVRRIERNGDAPHFERAAELFREMQGPWRP